MVHSEIKAKFTNVNNGTSRRWEIPLESESTKDEDISSFEGVINRMREYCEDTLRRIGDEKKEPVIDQESTYLIFVYHGTFVSFETDATFEDFFENVLSYIERYYNPFHNEIYCYLCLSAKEEGAVRESLEEKYTLVLKHKTTSMSFEMIDSIRHFVYENDLERTRQASEPVHFAESNANSNIGRYEYFDVLNTQATMELMLSMFFEYVATDTFADKDSRTRESEVDTFVTLRQAFQSLD
jgi:hypothetical protein